MDNGGRSSLRGISHPTTVALTDGFEGGSGGDGASGGARVGAANVAESAPSPPEAAGGTIGKHHDVDDAGSAPSPPEAAGGVRVGAVNVTGSPPNAPGAAADGVRVDAVDVSGLCDAGLRARLRELGRADSALAAMKADTLGEIARRKGSSVAEHTARDTLSISGRAARGDVKAAVALGGLDVTREGLADGAVPAGHAQLIARAAGDAPIDEAFLAARAQCEGYDEFRRTVARHVADATQDDGAAVLERQRQARSGKIYTRGYDGMTAVSLVVDPVAGARLGAAIAAAERRLFQHEDPQREDPAARRTPAQRTADAITQLILEPDAKRPAGTSLIIVADYDTLNHQLANARLANGTPIPIGEIAKIATDAELLPTIFNAATGDLRMGRSRRTATDLQRAALALRDRGCVGCGTPPERCQHHHIDHWQHGGHTDYHNLVTVCPHCHNDKIHQQGFTIQPHPHGPSYRLQEPDQPPTQPARPPTGQTLDRPPEEPATRNADQSSGPRGRGPTRQPTSPPLNRPTERLTSEAQGRSAPRAPPR